MSSDEHVPWHEDADAVKEEDDVDELVSVFGGRRRILIVGVVQTESLLSGAEFLRRLQRHH